MQFEIVTYLNTTRVKLFSNVFKCKTKSYRYQSVSIHWKWFQNSVAVVRAYICAQDHRWFCLWFAAYNRRRKCLNWCRFIVNEIRILTENAFDWFIRFSVVSTQKGHIGQKLPMTNHWRKMLWISERILQSNTFARLNYTLPIDVYFCDNRGVVTHIVNWPSVV